MSWGQESGDIFLSLHSKTTFPRSSSLSRFFELAGFSGTVVICGWGGAGLLRGCGQMTAGVVVIRMTAELRGQDSFLSVPHLGRLSSWKMDGQASLSLHASIPSMQFTCASSQHGSLSHKAAGLLQNRRSRFLMTKPQKSHSITLPVSCESKFHPRAQVQGAEETTQRHEYWEVWLIGGGGGRCLWKLTPFHLANFLYVTGQNGFTGPFLNQSLVG